MSSLKLKKKTLKTIKQKMVIDFCHLSIWVFCAYWDYSVNLINLSTDVKNRPMGSKVTPLSVGNGGSPKWMNIVDKGIAMSKTPASQLHCGGKALHRLGSEETQILTPRSICKLLIHVHKKIAMQLLPPRHFQTKIDPLQRQPTKTSPCAVLRPL